MRAKIQLNCAASSKHTKDKHLASWCSSSGCVIVHKVDGWHVLSRGFPLWDIYEVVGLVKRTQAHTCPDWFERAVKGARRAFISTLEGSLEPQTMERGTKRNEVQWSFVLSGCCLVC